ncbi:MAG: preprotein translocase subunit SecE [Bacteriovoracaceae bacterium]|jgi:preprotein translocase subunit SecE
MSLTAKDNGKKWIQSSVAFTCLLLVYILIKFFTQMGEWFELESKIQFYMGITQMVSVMISFGTFIYIVKNEKTSSFLEEVFQEAVKVVWPDKNETVKHTVGIMIGVTIVGTLLAVFDLAATWLLSLVN